MSKLTNAEKDKLDNTCGNLRVTKLGTHVKSLEDFVNEMQLDTRADTVAEAINELYSMIVDKDCEAIQVPPPGFFTLWGNDEDGKLYCYYNDEDHPPLFRHVETPGEDEGTLYLYIADPEGDNHYEMEIGHYIAVKHLENYYTKTEIQNGYAIKNHAVNAATYGKGTSGVFGHLKVANNLTTTSTDAIALAAAQGKVLKDLIDGKSDNGHKHNKNDITNFPTKVSEFTNDKGYLTSHQSLADYAKTAYVDQQIANIEGDIEVDFASKADVDHSHGYINKDGVISNQKSKNVVTDSNGKITTEDKLVVDSALSSDSTNPVQNKKVKEALDSINGSISTKVDKVNGKSLSSNDFTDILKAKLDAIDEEANKYTHPSTHPSTMIVEASALSNIGSAANANQHAVNDKINNVLGGINNALGSINNALAGKVDKVNGKGLSTHDFTDIFKSEVESVSLLRDRYMVKNDISVRLIRTKADGSLYPQDTMETFEGSILKVNVGDKLNIQVISQSGQNPINNLNATLVMGSTVKQVITTSNGRIPNADAIGLNNGQDGVAHVILKGDLTSHNKTFDIVYVKYGGD